MIENGDTWTEYTGKAWEVLATGRADEIGDVVCLLPAESFSVFRDKVQTPVRVVSLSEFQALVLIDCEPKSASDPARKEVPRFVRRCVAS